MKRVIHAISIAAIALVVTCATLKAAPVAPIPMAIVLAPITLSRCITITATIMRITTMGIIIIVGAGIMVTTVTTKCHSRRSENRERR